MLKGKKVLILGKLWPEPKSSGAGTRMMQLIRFYLDKRVDLTFACSAKKTGFESDIESLGVKTKEIVLNDSSFDTFIRELNPEIVIFDRFITEEYFGWRVVEACPDAIRILNTEDMHFLREARGKAVKSKTIIDINQIRSEMALREIASIYRCDLSLLVSSIEIQLLTDYYQVPKDLLFYFPLCVDKVFSSVPTFEERSDFIFIGNYYHEPNWDALRYLKTEIWPLIRKKLPKVKLNVYGAYPSEKVFNLNNVKEGFCIRGRAEDAFEVTQKAKVSLVPLRFGAGIKGKLLEAMACGTPNVTTTIGAEAMHYLKDWSGFITDNPVDFAENAIALYKDGELWQKGQDVGRQIIESRFTTSLYLNDFEALLTDLILNLDTKRNKYLISQLIQHQSLRSTKYFSKWIELKDENLKKN